jgi:hypothetical protein
VRFEVTASFKADYKRLTAVEQQAFHDALKDFVPACDRFAIDPSTKWPAGLRVKGVESATGILEMTWSSAGPDGRATFEWVQIAGTLGVRWRRVGGHGIFRDP